MPEQNLPTITPEPISPPYRRFEFAYLVAFLLAIGLFLSIGMNMFLVAKAAKAPDTFLALGGTGQAYEEAVIEGHDDDEKIVIISVNGIITGGNSQSGPFAQEDMVLGAINRLQIAREDADVKGVLLEVNSPGGSVYLSDLLHGEVKKTIDAGKKVVVYMESVAASGGYYISAPADRIFAHPTCVTGSIGVIMQIPNLTGTLEKIGAEMVTIKSGEKKDWGSMFHDMSEEEKAYLQNIIDQMFERFVGVVADGRALSMEDVLKLATGEAYTAKDALDRRLIDQIGRNEDALDALRKLIGNENAQVVRYEKSLSEFEKMFLKGAPLVEMNSGINIDAGPFLESSPRIMYLWAPGR